MQFGGWFTQYYKVMHFQITLSVICVQLVLWQRVCCDGDDGALEGHLLKVKPDGSMFTTAELIDQQPNYKSEVHKVTTEDGYILKVFRVLSSSTSSPSLSPVLLQHGILASSDVWITDPGALAFKLVDAGFDVWVNNNRGNAYSRNHSTLKPEEKNFWDFSWHEMGTKDLPAVIDYILNENDQKFKKVHYIGHCTGTTIGLVMASTNPEMNDKLVSFSAFGPVAFLSKMRKMVGPDGMVEVMVSDYMEEYKKKDKFEIFHRKDIATNNETQFTCQDMDEMFASMCDANIEMAQNFIGGPYIPTGTSFKTMDHCYQMSVYGEMRYYNMSSKEENQKAYGSEEPAKYSDKFKNIKVPVLLWSGKGDQFVMFEDSDNLAAILPSVVANNKIDEDCFDHTTFLFPVRKSCVPVREKLYNNCIEAMKKLENK